MRKIPTKPLGVIFWLTALTSSITWQLLRLLLTNVPGIVLSSRASVLAVACIMLTVPLLLGMLMMQRRSEYKMNGLIIAMLMALLFEIGQCMIGFKESA